MGINLILNAFDVPKRTLFIKEAASEGFGHILMQNRNEEEVEVRAQTRNNEGRSLRTEDWWS